MPTRLRAAAAVALAAVLLPGVAAAAPLLPAAGPVPAYDAADTTRLYALVNAHRRTVGAPPLTRDTRLETMARAWTMSMASSGDLGHNDSLFTRATHSAMGIAEFGENVAYSSRGVDGAHQALLASPHHRDNIENPSYAVGGFAVVHDAKGITWVTEDFGTAPGAVKPPAKPVAKPAPPPRTAPARPAPARSAPAKPTAPARRVAPAAPAPARTVWAAPRRESPTDRLDVPVDVAFAAPSAPAAPIGPARTLAIAVAALLLAAVAAGHRKARRA